jgi:hypothetical protein
MTQVVIGYTVNSGIVVMIIVVNYLLAFQPEMDPFLPDKPDALPRSDFKPNPIDKLVITLVREKFKIRSKLSKRVEEALMKVYEEQIASPLTMHMQLTPDIVRSQHERFPNPHRIVYTHQRLFPNAQWDIQVPLENPRLSGLVFQPDPFWMS